MARDRVPVLKRCRSLNLDPIYLGIDKKSKKQNLRANRKLNSSTAYWKNSSVATMHRLKKSLKKKVSLVKTF